jgi:hypothetical protein
VSLNEYISLVLSQRDARRPKLKNLGGYFVVGRYPLLSGINF